MDFEHHYAIRIDWTGDRGSGTSDYRAYGRDHVISSAGKASIDGSSDRAFRGDDARWNPEEMLLAALSQCHMLSYLHVAASRGVVVTGYRDSAEGTMIQTKDGGGHFVSAILSPEVTVVAGTDVDLVQSLHSEAAAKCFIAASVNFDVEHRPRVVVAEH